MIFLALMLGVDLVSRKETEMRTTPKDRRAEIQTMQTEVARLEALLTATATQGSKPVDQVQLAKELVAAEEESRRLARERDQLRAKAGQEQQVAVQLLAALEERKRQQGHLQDQLQSLRTALTRVIEDTRVFFIPEEGTTKIPVLVVCTKDKIRMGRLGDTVAQEYPVSAAGRNSCLSNIRQRSRLAEYVVFIIKPTATEYAMALVSSVRQEGFDVGYDALEEDKDVAFRR